MGVGDPASLYSSAYTQFVGITDKTCPIRDPARNLNCRIIVLPLGPRVQLWVLALLFSALDRY